VRIASLGSGSRGNATLIDDGDTCLLIDLGFSLKETVSRMRRLGREPEDIAAILVTHEHADHVGGVAAFAKKFDVPVYLTPGTHKAARLGKLPAMLASSRCRYRTMRANPASSSCRHVAGGSGC